MAKTGNRVRYGGFWVLVAAVILGYGSSGWCVQADYDGLYSGTFIGDDSGRWVGSIDSETQEYLFLLYSTQREDADGGELIWQGEDSGVGQYRGYSDWNDSLVNVNITAADGSVQGTWSNTGAGEEGEIEGDKVTSCPDAGSYSGKYSGDDSGTWTMSIGENCLLTGTMTSDGASSSFVGGCSPNGYVFMAGEDTYGADYIGGGKIADGKITGTWKSQNGDEGTFGNNNDDDDDTCFIQSVLMH